MALDNVRLSICAELLNEVVALAEDDRTKNIIAIKEGNAWIILMRGWHERYR